MLAVTKFLLAGKGGHQIKSKSRMSATSDLKQSPFSSSDSPGSSPKHAHTLSADSSPPRKPRIEVEYLFGQSHHILRITVDFQSLLAYATKDAYKSGKAFGVNAGAKKQAQGREGYK